MKRIYIRYKAISTLTKPTGKISQRIAGSKLSLLLIISLNNCFKRIYVSFYNYLWI